jgi:hypothetical protein
MTTDQRLLRKTMDEVREAHTSLVDPIKRGFLTDSMEVSTHIAPSLLNQLRQAVATGNSTGGVRGRGTPLPISADAHDLLGTITESTMGMLRHFGTTPAGRAVEPNLREVVACCGLSTDLEALLGVRGFLRAWVASIRSMFDPPKRIYLWGHPCPVCNSREVFRLDESDGEEKRIAPLEVAFVESETGERKIKDVHCLACLEEWLPSQLMWLGRLLGQEIPGVETEGEPAA